MINGIIGRKLGMTQVYAADGSVSPVTVIKAGPCVVVQRKTATTDGYEAVQLCLVEEKPVRRINKPMRGHFEKAGLPPARILREFRVEPSADGTQVGDKVLVDQFIEGDLIDVIGTTKGRGFAGSVKRHHFHGGGGSHGSMMHRAPGSIGGSSYPSRVWPGTRMAGHLGTDRRTLKNLTVVRVVADKHLLLVQGAVPGPNGGFVLIKKKARR
ncbi:MAG: 50S ribosomal protein L3 [Acidobacteria bacterium]|nr:50S ribosomal protein L3 [Acidobacteriota bacterium]